MAKKKDSEKQNASENSKNGEEPNFDDPEGFVDDVSDEGKPSSFNVFCNLYVKKLSKLYLCS